MNARHVGIAGLLVAAVGLIGGGVAWAQTIHSDIATLQERTRGIDSMQRDIREIAEGVSAIRARNDSNDSYLDMRLMHIEESLRR
jgi:hypothetical protein